MSEQDNSEINNSIDNAASITNSTKSSNSTNPLSEPFGSGQNNVQFKAYHKSPNEIEWKVELHLEVRTKNKILTRSENFIEKVQI